MISTKNFSVQFEWLHTTAMFLKTHFAVVFMVGFVAGFGRVIQLNGFGRISLPIHIALEVVIESARLLLIVYVIGSASYKSGFVRIARVFRHRESRKLLITKAVQTLKTQWKRSILDFSCYLLLAWVINFVIDQLAYETCLLLQLKQNGLLSTVSSEWTIILFFKNLTVIPITLVFNIMFLFWISDKTRLIQFQGRAAI